MSVKFPLQETVYTQNQHTDRNQQKAMTAIFYILLSMS